MRQAQARLRGGLSSVVRAVVAVLVALASTGCVSGPPLITSLPPLPPSETPPAGTVMLVMSDDASARIQEQGLVGAGGGRGLFLGVPVVVPVRGVTHSPSAAAAAVGVGVGVGIGVELGIVLVDAALRYNAQKNTATVLRAFDDMRVAEALVDKILEAGHSYRILPPTVADPDTGTPDVDTFLELERPQVSLTSNDTTVSIPDLHLRVAVSAKLARASDTEELARWSWEHRGPTVSLSKWGEDDAHLFRTELERALGTIGSRAVIDIAPDPVQTLAGGET